jgi:hypothetical protein
MLLAGSSISRWTPPRRPHVKGADQSVNLHINIEETQNEIPEGTKAIV